MRLGFTDADRHRQGVGRPGLPLGRLPGPPGVSRRDLHLRHDDAPVLLARTLADYLAAFEALDDPPRASFLDATPERLACEEQGAQQLVAHWSDEDDWPAYALAISLVRENLGLLVSLVDDEEVGELALARLRELVPPAAA